MAVRYYYARSAMIDSQIGVLYAALEASGQLDNTVIIFTADHGETLGSHGGLLDKGWHHFEETHRIPMIVRMPDGAGAGKRRDELVSQPTSILPCSTQRETVAKTIRRTDAR